jgi:hypothetical protein
MTDTASVEVWDWPTPKRQMDTAWVPLPPLAR